MPTTAIYGVITFLLVLGPLVILHELGHFFMARRFGVKVIEFGFGFPPRAGGMWTGRSLVKVDASTTFDFADGKSGLKTGQVVTIVTMRDTDASLVARVVRPHSGKQDTDDRVHGGPLIFGKLRSLNDDSIVISEMLWSFNWLPVGGFVRMVGEEDPTAPESLASKPRWQRISVMAAGAGVNFLIPFILFPAILLIPRTETVGDVRLTSVLPGSPAEMAGLKPGDWVLKVDGRPIEHVGDLQQAVTVKLGAESTWLVRKAQPDPFPQPGADRYQYPGGPVEVQVTPRWKPPRRAVVEEVVNQETEVTLARARLYDVGVGLNDSLMVVQGSPSDTLREISVESARRDYPERQQGDRLQVVPEVRDARSEISFEDARRHDSRLGVRTYLQEGAVGVLLETANPRQVSQSLAPWKAVPEGLRSALDVIVLTKNGIEGLVIGSKNPQFSGPSTVGPIGIGQLTGEVAVADASFTAKVVTLASLAAALSFSLAVVNILPIPALDGGRVLFVVIEWARRGKRIPPEREGLVHLIGFAILLGLIALVSVRDIARIIRGDSFF